MFDDEPAPKPSISELRKQYNEERLYQDDRAAGEYAYALAVRLREVGQLDDARKYARECRTVDLATLASERRAQRQEARVQSEARAQFLRYPAEGRLMPTMLGNILRSGEDRAGGRYGLDSMAAYPRIYPYLHPKLDSALSKQLDLIAITSALCISFALAGFATVPVLLHHPSWFPVPVVAFALSVLSYSAALRAASGHGALFGVAFDLHRFDMLHGLHYPLPEDPSDEFSFNRALSQMWLREMLASRAVVIKDTKYVHQRASAESSSSEPASPKPTEDLSADKGDGAEGAKDM